MPITTMTTINHYLQTQNLITIEHEIDKNHKWITTTLNGTKTISMDWCIRGGKREKRKMMVEDERGDGCIGQRWR